MLDSEPGFQFPIIYYLEKENSPFNKNVEKEDDQ